MKKSVLVLAALLLVAMLVGCGGGQSAADDIVGVWAVANDDSSLTQGTEIEFGEDGWMTMPFISENSERAQYELTDGTLVITKSDNSVENGQMTVDGDTATLVLPGRSRGTYQLVRVGTQAYEEAMTAAEEAENQEAAAQDTADAEAIEQKACARILREYDEAFRDWAEKTYPDIKIAHSEPRTAMEAKGVTLNWDFPTFSENVDYAGSFSRSDFEANLNGDEYDYDETKKTAFVDMVEAGECPSGGTYTIEWKANNALPYKISCSVHGEN